METDADQLIFSLRVMADLVQEYSDDDSNPNVSAWLRGGAADSIRKLAEDTERLRRYEDHVGGLHCPEWHAETCEWQERCDEPDCKKESTCGWPSPEGYRRTCSEHYAR